MFQIDDKIISDDLFEVNFVCNLDKCKGICCVDGDSGAPLTEEEAKLMGKVYPIIKKYLPLQAISEIEKQGLYITDYDGDLVTPTINNRECVYAYYDEKGIVKCAFEKAYLNNEIDFIKPISCHLYPVRIKEYEEFFAVNYDERSICKAALIKGKKEKTPLFKFLEVPLKRMFGNDFYEQLEVIYEEFFLKNNK